MVLTIKKALIEIAKLGALQNGEKVGCYIKNFGIKDQDALVEIAKLIAQKHGLEISYYINNFEIKDQAALIEIAKIAAQQDGGGTSKYIRNYRIENPEVLIQIAKLAAQQDGKETSQNILNYNIENQEALIEIANLATRQNGLQTSLYIHFYRIKDQQALIELAKLSAQRSGELTSVFIQKYGIENKEALIEIAKLAAQQNGEETSKNIKNYGIENKKALIDIAKLAAQQDGKGTSQYIRNYGIEDQGALIEIAKLAAKQDGGGTSVYFQTYGIVNEADRLEIFLIAFKNNPKDCLLFKENYKLSFFKELNFTVNSSSSDIQKAYRWPNEFSFIFKGLSQAPDDFYFIIYLGCKLSQKSPFLKDPFAWGTIFLYKDLQMRYELADLVFALDEPQAKLYECYSTPSYLELPALIFCFSSQNEKEAKSYHDLLKDRREFRDGMLQKALLDVLQPLIVRHQFVEKEVTNLLKKAFSGSIQSNLFSIQGTLYCGGKDRLRQEARSDNPDLEAAYQATFGGAIPIKPIKDFSTKYQQTFGKCALPSAPLIYAGRLRCLPKWEQEKALLALASFVHSVLEKDYPKNRYERSESLDKEFGHVDHLKMIFGKKPSLQKDWPLEGLEVEKSLEDYLFTSDGKFSFNPQNFLNEKIVRDKHLSKIKYPLLFEYLENKDPAKVKPLIENFNKLLTSNAERTKEIALQKVNLRNAVSSLDDIEKKKTKGELDDIEKQNKVKAGRLLRVLTTVKMHLEGLHEINESLKDIEKLDSDDPGFLKNVQMYVDRFKKAVVASPPQLSDEDAEQQRLLLLQKDLIDLYRYEKAPLSQHLNQLIKIQGKLGQSQEEFVNDVKGLVKALQKQKQSFEGYTITNTDRFDHMLLCGTQVQGSCQRIDGDPNLNKCLLAYCLDGKNRLIAIKDKEGNIVARSILRLLWDKQNDCPALMQERVYSNIPDESLTRALNNFALAEAERLGINLYTSEGKGSVSLESFGSVAPWEYVDSAGGVHDAGKFTITNAGKA